MEIEKAQRDVRQTYLGGFAGQLVSGLIWLASAALGTWGTERSAILVLALGGFFIFPLTTLFLKLSGRLASLGPGHPMNALGMQAAFVLPLTLPLVGAAALYRIDWFYPAFMIALGAHYLPFVFLYGMRMFAGLCAGLVGSGVLIGLYGPRSFTLGGWVTAAILIVAAFAGRMLTQREQAETSAAGRPAQA